MKIIYVFGLLAVLYGHGSHGASMATEHDVDEALGPLLRGLSEEQKVGLIEALLLNKAEQGADSQLSERNGNPPYDEAQDRYAEVVMEKVRQLRTQAEGVTSEMRESQGIAMKMLARYLQGSERMRQKGLTARAHIEAVRALRELMVSTRGLSEEQANEEFSLTLHRANTETITRGPDETVTLEDGVCYVVNVDCSTVVTSQYRTFDGSCNNLRPGQTNWGGIERAFARYLPPQYSDGLSEPREGRHGELPTAREVSLAMKRLSRIDDNDQNERESRINSLLMMQVGQFLDHDLTRTPAQEGAACDCTSGDECFPIPLEAGHGLGDCISFVRSEHILVDSCDLGHAEQGNTLTSWIDAGQVYGGTIEEAEELRDHTSEADFGRVHGRLAMRDNPVVGLPDKLLPKVDTCADEDNCNFVAGDIRVNEQPGLTSMHTIFVRLHNVFEERLYRRHSTWDAETLYQETRRVVIAVWQKIAVDEYLQVLIGKRAYDEYGLSTNSYDDSVQSDIANVFATAAFRFGHTEVPDLMPFMDMLHTRTENKNLDDSFFNPSQMYRCPMTGVSSSDSLLTGMSAHASEEIDAYVSDTLREHLFGGGNGAPGLDLPALNIQRGRDHGIPGYADWLRFCRDRVDDRNLRSNMRDLVREYNLDVRRGLEDMDLFPALVSEEHTLDGQMGPTLTCLLGRQFSAIKNGDRFYFRHPDSGFNRDQVREIENYSLASVLCETMNDGEDMQPLAMLQSWDQPLDKRRDSKLFDIYGAFVNERTPCNDLPHINFDLF